MHTMISILSLLTFVSVAAAASHDVLVGNTGIVYSPNSTTAAVGDTVVFHFYPGNHNVVQGAFNEPCSTSGGFYSGFIDSQSGAAANTFTVIIMDTNPIWIYCSQVEHCQLGMVMVINPPSSGDTLAEYAAASAKTSMSTTPNNIGGGVIGSASGSGSSSSSSASMSSAASSSVSSSSASSASSASSSTASSASSASSVSSMSSVSSASSASSVASSSTSQASTSTTSSTTSASASATGNNAVALGENTLLSGLVTVLTSLAFWIGLL